MYISIGGDMAVRDGSIIGVLLNVTEDIPKTFLVTEEYGMEKVYFTQLSAATLEKRTENGKQQESLF